jgi:hypothetical protein
LISIQFFLNSTAELSNKIDDRIQRLKKLKAFILFESFALNSEKIELKSKLMHSKKGV